MESAGGFALFLGLIVLIGVGLWRQWWVPGFWYRAKDAEVKELRIVVSRLTTQLNRERRRRGTDA